VLGVGFSQWIDSKSIQLGIGFGSLETLLRGDIIHCTGRVTASVGLPGVEIVIIPEDIVRIGHVGLAPVGPTRIHILLLIILTWSADRGLYLSKAIPCKIQMPKNGLGRLCFDFTHSFWRSYIRPLPMRLSPPPELSHLPKCTAMCQLAMRLWQLQMMVLHMSLLGHTNPKVEN
jgi:hypothetical protein